MNSKKAISLGYKKDDIEYDDIVKKFIEKIALSLILGGAIGNGIDRVIKEYVVDFIDISLNNFHWPAFNVADSSITVGGIVYFWLIIFKKNH